MADTARNLLLSAAFVVAAAATIVGALVESAGLITIGAALATIGSAILARRLWSWSKQTSMDVKRTGRDLTDWEFRPGYLIALLGCALFVAVLALDAGAADIALWTLPVAMGLLLVTMGRARTDSLLRELLFPTRTPPPR